MRVLWLMAIYLGDLQFKRCRRQGYPLSGYLFILCIEIFALALRNSKAKRYQTPIGNKHLQEQYADDLSIFLEYVDGDDDLNASNIKNILDVPDAFFLLSGLGFNKAKTMLSMFVSTQDKSNLAGLLGLKSVH